MTLLRRNLRDARSVPWSGRKLAAWAGVWVLWLAGVWGAGRLEARPAERPFFESEPIFPSEPIHNHASSIVETPKGGLLVCWFHGSGERSADDVLVQGARLRSRGEKWSSRFVLADTPGFPDCNPVLFVDPKGQLWLFYVTILANTWESAVLKSRTSIDYEREGPPKWKSSEVVPLKPGKEFQASLKAVLPGYERTAMEAKPKLSAADWREVENTLAAFREGETNKLYQRLGWMTRIHPVTLEGSRLIVPVYHDGFSCSLFAITDDWGGHWHTSTPLIGGGNVQPSVAVRRDGSLFAIMRDNGPPPNRAMRADSHDRGETWSEVTDTEIPNPGSSLEVIVLRTGRWLLIGNDSEENRHSLAAWTSDNEGGSWQWRRSLAKQGPLGENFSYPSVIQDHSGNIHVTFSAAGAGRSTILHCRFNEAWLLAQP